LAPEQARALSITERSAEYANEVVERLCHGGIRAEADVRNEKIGAKIREAQLDKVPAMLIVGDREAESRTVALRLRKQGDLGAVTAERFLEQALEWTTSRTLEIDWPDQDEEQRGA
jgi:threonyl-tRNA synthetase